MSSVCSLSVVDSEKDELSNDDNEEEEHVELEDTDGRREASGEAGDDDDDAAAGEGDVGLVVGAGRDERMSAKDVDSEPKSIGTIAPNEGRRRCCFSAAPLADTVSQSTENSDEDDSDDGGLGCITTREEGRASLSFLRVLPFSVRRRSIRSCQLCR
jgi:hypothetical protein